MARLYQIMYRRIIRIESLGLETRFHLVPIQQNPFHFGRTGVDDKFHAITDSEASRLMSKG